MLPIGSAASYGINYTHNIIFFTMTMEINLILSTQKRQQRKSKIKVTTWILVVDLVASSVQHTIKIKCYSGNKCISQSLKMNLRDLQQKKDRLNNVYDSDGEPGTFCDMEDLEDTQYFYEYALPDVFTPDSGKFYYGYEGNKYVAGGGDKSNP